MFFSQMLALPISQGHMTNSKTDQVRALQTGQTLLLPVLLDGCEKVGFAPSA